MRFTWLWAPAQDEREAQTRSGARRTSRKTMGTVGTDTTHHEDFRREGNQDYV
jgi:hypothetical protein